MTDGMHKWLINIVFSVKSHLTAAEGIAQQNLMSGSILLADIEEVPTYVIVVNYFHNIYMHFL